MPFDPILSSICADQLQCAVPSTAADHAHLIAMLVDGRWILHIDCMHGFPGGCNIASAGRARRAAGVGLRLRRRGDCGGVDGCHLVAACTLDRLRAPGIHESDMAA